MELKILPFWGPNLSIEYWWPRQHFVVIPLLHTVRCWYFPGANEKSKTHVLKNNFAGYSFRFFFSSGSLFSIAKIFTFVLSLFGLKVFVLWYVSLLFWVVFSNFLPIFDVFCYFGYYPEILYDTSYFRFSPFKSFNNV